MNIPLQIPSDDSVPLPVHTDWRTTFLAACQTLPEVAPVPPYESTPEGRRWASFKHVCPPQFIPKIDRTLIPHPAPFDAVANWDGRFPGPCAFGPTDTAKTRAAWWALRQLYVRGNKPFAWFPVRRLITELKKFADTGYADEFFRQYDHFSVLLVDDVDKVNWDFTSDTEALFAFYDWVYRSKKPCISTTNKPREWWDKMMGEAFSRRLFIDAHYAVKF